jgi:hypothetical protein
MDRVAQIQFLPYKKSLISIENVTYLLHALFLQILNKLMVESSVYFHEEF